MEGVAALTGWQITVFAIYGLILAGTAARHLLCHIIIRRTTFLTPDSVCWKDAQPPRVSIIVPAKDEAANLEQCLASLRSQDYPNYEILVVDDRSADDTAEIAQSVARRDPRVRVLRISSLPDGWTGKNHALHVAQKHATGEWLLFVDADASLHPTCLSVVLRDAVDQDAGLTSLLPRMEMRSFWERVVQPIAATLLMTLFPLPRVNDRSRTDCGFANGQFLMMRRSAYDAIGGHEAVKDKFCEDINLGRLVKRHQLGLRVVVAPALASVRMYSSLPQILRGWSRIFYAAMNAQAAFVVAFAVAVFLLSGVPYVVVPGCLFAIAAGVTGPLVWGLLVLAIVHEAAQTTLYLRAYWAGHSPLWLLVWRPLGTAAIFFMLWKTFRLCRTHQIEWRGTQYATFSQLETVPEVRRAA